MTYGAREVHGGEEQNPDDAGGPDDPEPGTEGEHLAPSAFAEAGEAPDGPGGPSYWVSEYFLLWLVVPNGIG